MDFFTQMTIWFIGLTGSISYSLGTIQNFEYEILTITSATLYCKKSASLRNSKLGCLAESRSGWVVGYSKEQCLICYYDEIEPQFKLFNGRWDSFIWMTQKSKVHSTYIFTRGKNCPRVL